MKRTTFRPSIRFGFGDYHSPTHSGWAYAHAGHPGRAFIIHHPFVCEDRNVVATEGWVCSDVASGHRLHSTVHPTRKACAAFIGGFLATITPARLAQEAERKLLEAATETLQVAA